MLYHHTAMPINSTNEKEMKFADHSNFLLQLVDAHLNLIRLLARKIQHGGS